MFQEAARREPPPRLQGAAGAHPDITAEILFGLLESLGTAGNLTTDAHLAALAIEHQAELHSTDADVGRLPGLRWLGPVA